VLVTFAGAIAATFFSSGNVQGGLFLLNVQLVGAAPIAIARSIVKRGVIDVRTVLGAPLHLRDHWNAVGLPVQRVREARAPLGSCSVSSA
jgi:hypothetical protein